MTLLRVRVRWYTVVREASMKNNKVCYYSVKKAPSQGIRLKIMLPYARSAVDPVLKPLEVTCAHLCFFERTAGGAGPMALFCHGIL